MKKRKINYQKIFCFISLIFLITCCLWYGSRLIYFYIDNNKVEENKTNNLAQTIINQFNGTDNFKNTNGEYYFYNDASNNYVMYSNILWRVVKITSTKGTVLISDSNLTSLAYGKNKDYEKSYVSKWLNHTDNLTGILEQNINNENNNLIKTKTCIDSIKSIETSSCKDTLEDNYIGLLSVVDYINTGASNSFINNGINTYLSNTNNDNNVWYINEEGKLDTSDGTDIYGIKPVITLSSSNNIASGNGTNDDPYIIETTPSLLASYVNLDGDIWRVYNINEETLDLSLDSPLDTTHIYSNNNYYHNDTKSGSLAYYLNNEYLKELTYKDIINTHYWPNYYYGEETDYDYQKVLENTVETKVSNLSIGNIILNTNKKYFTNTGISKSSSTVYSINNNTISTTKVTIKSNIIPCININKNLLTKGSGTIDDPYEME